VADLFNAGSPDEIVFGQNMTSLTFAVSRALARSWGEGDEIIVSRLDHDANITPWVMAAADRGVRVRWADFDPEAGCQIDVAGLEAMLPPTRSGPFPT
jgi:selenocysteine lyase/cysteine desulfurase